VIIIQSNDETKAATPNAIRKYAATKIQNRKSGAALKSGVTSIQSAKPNTKLPREMNINCQYGRLKFISKI